MGGRKRWFQAAAFCSFKVTECFNTRLCSLTMLLKYLEPRRVLVPLGGHGRPAKSSTTRRTEPGLGLSWRILLPWTHPLMEAREDKVQMQEECCVPPCSASGPSSWTGVGGSGFGYFLQNQAWPEEGLWMAGGGGAAGQSWGLGLADGGRGWPVVGGVSLTCTHAYCVPRVVPAVVAVEAAVGVADRSLCAVVPQLLGTHLAALAAIRDEADAQRAAWRGRWALARPLAELGA